MRDGSASRSNAGTRGVHLICTLYPSAPTKTPHNSLLIAPALSGLTARPRAATLPLIAVLNYASGKAGGRCAPRLGDCGARAGGTGSAGCAGRRRIVAALGRGSLLWAPTKRGRQHQTQTTYHDQVPRAGSRPCSPSISLVRLALGLGFGIFIPALAHSLHERPWATCSDVLVYESDISVVSPINVFFRMLNR